MGTDESDDEHESVVRGETESAQSAGAGDQVEIEVEVDTSTPETDDGFDRTMEVDTAPSAPGDRPQNLEQVNISDPRSRAETGRVPAQQAIKDAENEDRRKIRSKIVYPVLIGAGLQFITADVVFVIYAAQVHWQLSSMVVSAWLSATVVQVVGVVLVVMNYLFPKDI